MTAPAPTVSRDAGQAAAGAAALGVLQIVGRSLGLVFVVVATRVVLPGQFGDYSIVAGLVVFAGFLADFGSSTVITRTVSRDPASSDAILAETLVASVVVGLLAYAGIVAYLVCAPYSSHLVALGLIGGLAVPADAALTSMLAAMDGHGLISRRAVVSFVRVAVVAGGGALAVALSGSIEPAVVMLAAGPVIGCALAIWATRRYRVWTLVLHPHWGRSLWLFRTALPYALLGGIGAIVARFDLLVLSWFAPTRDVAPYDLALRAVEATTALGMVVGGPALFILSKRLGSRDVEGARRAYGHAVRAAYLLGLPMTAIVVGLHTPLTRVAFGPHYSDAGPLLAVLGLSIALAILGWVQGSVVLAGDHVGRALRGFGGVLVAAVLVDLALIPGFGAPGAAVATVLIAVTSCVVFDRLNRRTLGIATPVPDAGVAIASVVACAVMSAGSVLGLGWLQCGGLVLLPLLLLVTGAVSTADLRRLRALVVRGGRA